MLKTQINCKIFIKQFAHSRINLIFTVVINQLKIKKMAYITTNQVKEIRKKINENFSTKDGWKFSIRNENSMAVRIVVKSAPVNYLAKYRNGYSVIPKNQDCVNLQRIWNIANAGNWDNSDSMTDYFDVGWYVNLYIGNWEQPFEFKTSKN